MVQTLPNEKWTITKSLDLDEFYFVNIKKII
jgi:hypothetical protein